MNLALLAYLGARLKEASSYAGAATMVLAALGFTVNPGLVSAALALIAALGGLIAVAIPERTASSPADRLNAAEADKNSAAGA